MPNNEALMWRQNENVLAKWLQKTINLPGSMLKSLKKDNDGFGEFVG